MRKLPLLAVIACFPACSAAPTPPAASASAEAAPLTTKAAAVGAPADDSAAPRAGNSSQLATPGSTPTPVSTIASVDAREDAHWVQADDYFVATRAFTSGWLGVSIAKMKEPATAASKGEALFFVIHDGRELNSAYFYRTRPALKADLVLGNLLICFDNNPKDRVRRAPRDKDNARPGDWWLGRITDLSDLAKGYATLAGSYHCAPDALRAIVN